MRRNNESSRLWVGATLAVAALATVTIPDGWQLWPPVLLAPFVARQIRQFLIR